jgi:hypothetical protein
MILKKQSNPSAKWIAETSRWWIGESHEYQWIDSKNKPVSPWMDLNNALKWIKEYDESKKTN